MDVKQMLSQLEANGVMEMPIAMAGDLFDIARRCREGDPIHNWRGDPTMCVCLNPHTHEFEVWAIDRHGQEYRAASHHTLDQTLLQKLSNGDPLNNDVHQRVLDANAKVIADKKKADAEAFAQIGDRVQWAIRREWHNGRGNHTFIDRKVGASDGS
jgi:hypothetical protein